MIHALEAARMVELPIEVHLPEEYGSDELVARGVPFEERLLELASRAARAWGIERAAVPWAFPVQIADRLRADGIELRVDRDLFTERRRRKSDTELAGIRRAQRAADSAMALVRDELRRADASGPVLVLGGAPLTCERLKASLTLLFAEHGAVADDVIVSHGAQTAIGHHFGEGAIEPREPVIVDLGLRDRRTGCFTDMTRTFVVGDPPEELVEWHRLSVEALDVAVAGTQPGAQDSDVFAAVCEVFRAAGHATQLDKEPGVPLLDGFYHSLGHGVGLEIHEPPYLSRVPAHRLVAGEVLALEPGLYRQGFGGVRVEDLVLVTESGAERLTSFPYDLTLN
jgi:Xaa-Pro aminopeptidase